MVFDLRGDLADQFHEVVDDETDDMEAIGYDFCVWEGPGNEAPVRAGEVDANDPDLLPSLKTGEVRTQIRFTAARDDVEDAMVFEVGKGGGKALAFVEGVLVNTEDGRTLQAEAFGGLALGELSVDAGDGSRADVFDPSHGRSCNAFVVLLEDARSIGLGAPPPRQKSRKWLDEGAATIMAVVTSTVNDKPTRHIKAVEMTGPALILALAAQAYACAARARDLRALGGRNMDNKLIFVLACEHTIAFNSDSVIHRGHGGGSYRLMSPIFDQEPKMRLPQPPKRARLTCMTTA